MWFSTTFTRKRLYLQLALTIRYTKLTTRSAQSNISMLFQDTVLVIGLLADFSAAYTSANAMSMDITLKTNNNEYRFNTLTPENAAVLQKQHV